MTLQFGFINGKTEQKITKFIALMIFLFQPFFLETWAKTKQVLWSHKFHKQAFIKQQKGRDSHASRVVTEAWPSLDLPPSPQIFDKTMQF